MGRWAGPSASDPLFRIVWIVEESSKPDTAVSKLRVTRSSRNRRLEIRRRIIRWEQDQGVEECDNGPTSCRTGAREVIACLLRLAAVTEDHRQEILAAAVVAVVSTRTDTPEWRR